MLNYIKTMGWRRLGVIHTTNSYGASFAASITRHATDYGVSITFVEGVNFYSNSLYSENFKKALDNLRQVGSYINLFLCTDFEMVRALTEI